MFTVKQLSKLAGVTPRTLHHYDAIGLLKPTRVGENSYRYYGEDALFLLQQILFYRELDFPLKDIQKIMGNLDFDVIQALQSHKAALKREQTRINRLIRTVDATMDILKGEKQMNNKVLFKGFSAKEQEKYALEAEQLYDVETVRASNKKWKAYSTREKERILAEGKEIYINLIEAIPHGAADPQVQTLIARWHTHIRNFWKPEDDQLLLLAESYEDDPGFKANFDELDPRLAKFMREAVKVYVNNRRSKN